MPRAKLISTRGRYLAAVIEVDQQIYHVFDEFGIKEWQGALTRVEAPFY